MPAIHETCPLVIFGFFVTSIAPQTAPPYTRDVRFCNVVHIIIVQSHMKLQSLFLDPQIKYLRRWTFYHDRKEVRITRGPIAIPSMTLLSRTCFNRSWHVKEFGDCGYLM